MLVFFPNIIIIVVVCIVVENAVVEVKIRMYLYHFNIRRRQNLYVKLEFFFFLRKTKLFDYMHFGFMENVIVNVPRAKIDLYVWV